MRERSLAALDEGGDDVVRRLDLLVECLVLFHAHRRDLAFIAVSEIRSLAGQAQKETQELPWQRVINAQGKVSTHKLGFGDMQERLLEAEGVRFDPAGRCDLARLQWWPEEEGRDAPPEALL